MKTNVNLKLSSDCGIPFALELLWLFNWSDIWSVSLNLDSDQGLRGGAPTNSLL